MSAKLLFSAIIICLTLIQCKTDPEHYFPAQSKEQSNGHFEKYSALLDTAYQKGDYYTVAFQLANLKADAKYVFENLTKAVKTDTANCQKIFESYHHMQQDFLNNMVKADTFKFKEVFTLCKSLVGENGYDLYLQNYNKKVADYQASKEVLDSSKFDMKLVAELKEIHESDQEVRKRLTKRGNSEETRNTILAEMRIIDSINVQKVLAIIEKHGYPSKYLVGRDGAFTPVLVLHHHGDIPQKKGYRKILQKAIDDGLLGKGGLNMFDKRLNDMILADETKL